LAQLELPSKERLTAAIVAGCAVAFLGFGFAASFGVFLRPMSEELGWGREVFSLSVAVQALCWGIAQPMAGIVADRYGTARVLGVGALFAAVGFLIRGLVFEADVFVLSGVLVGIGTGACSFPIVIVALGKVMPADKRSFVMGLGTAAASLGMFAAAPASMAMIDLIGWKSAILVIAATYLAILPFLIAIARVSAPTAAAQGAGDFAKAIQTAFKDRSYLCLFFGFFVCGFHVAFIQTHLPAYVVDRGLAVEVGGWSLALIGLFNVAGSLISGWAGQVYSKKRALSGIYFTRAVIIAVFVFAPLSPTSVYLFSAAMGLLWLSTVPLTTGLVAQTQGLTYLATLAGMVFFSHQVGGFLGAWLGGRLYDIYQDYTAVWWMAIALGLAAALIHLPIKEEPGALAKAEA
jgi:predicted MFS family arabinose efflux permease